MRWITTSAIVLLAAALAAPAGAEETASPAAYDGKYAANADFRKRLVQLDGWREKALANVKDKLGIAPNDAKRIVIVVKDAIPAAPKKLAAFPDPLFQTFTEQGDKDPDVQILIRAEAFVNGADVEETLRHEMVHAVVRERMARDAHTKLPKWAREGLAVHAAGQSPERVVTIVTSQDAEKGLAPLFPGLDEGTHTLSRYAEDVLAIEYLITLAGKDAPKELVAKLVAGTDVKDAVAALAKTTWDDFKAKCRAWSLAAAEKAQPPEWKAYLDILALDRDKKWDDSQRACAQFVSKNAKSPLVPEVLYRQGKALRLDDKRPAAAKALRRLIGEFRGRSSFQDDAMYQLGQVLYEDKDWAGTAEVYEALLRDEPGTPLQDRALYFLAMCRSKLGDEKAGLAHVDLFERSFPKSSFADEVKKLRADLER